jgi:pyrroloquinoline-quinone synthase
MMPQPWSDEEFLQRLREVGAHAYHDRHPFHMSMNAGRLDPGALRLWTANRFYYQRSIPLKDAAILSNCPLREVRQGWVKRILDHDGQAGREGGIEKWLRLGVACGLTREEMVAERHVLPGVRFAVDAYVNFARTQPWPVAVASSLTELFAPDLMSKRLEAFRRFYAWIAPEGLDYFRARLTQAREDAEFALSVTLKYCAERQMQEAAVSALGFKCDVLWSILDALMIATGLPGNDKRNPSS